VNKINKNTIIIGVVVLVVAGGGLLFVLNQSGKKTQTQQDTTSQSQPTAQVGTSPATAKNSVTIQNMAFSPATLTIKVGDGVTWTNQDSIGHSATADDNSFDTGIIDQGQSGSTTFSKAGTYNYHCSVHPSMHGTIIVTQ
jgi:plastocyanin